MLTELQYQIIEDFAKTYIEDFLTFLEANSLEKGAMTALFECLLVTPPAEEIYRQLENQIVFSIKEKELQSKAASGLEDILLLFEGRFSEVKGNLGNMFKQYVADRRLTSNKTDDVDLVEGLRKVLPAYIPSSVSPKLQLVKPLAMHSLQENLATIYANISKSNNIIVSYEPFTHRTILHQLYLFFTPHFTSVSLPREWGENMDLLIGHLNNLLTLGANTQSMDIFHCKPLDYLIEKLPTAEKTDYKLAIEDFFKRIHILYTYHGASISQQQLENITNKGYALDSKVDFIYPQALLRMLPILPSDTIFSNTLQTLLKKHYQTSKIQLFSENDQACLEWLAEQYINLSVSSWEKAMVPLLLHKDILVRSVLGDPLPEKTLAIITTLLKTILYADRSMFEKYINAKLDPELLSFHVSLMNQGISLGENQHIDLLTDKLKKISASIKIKSALKKVAASYEKTDISGVYLAYLATLQTATPPTEAFNKFHKKVQLLLDKNYLLDFSQQSVMDVWKDIASGLGKKIKPYTWFWSLTSTLIYPIDKYQDIGHFLNIKKQLSINKTLNGTKELFLVHIRYILKLPHTVRITAILPFNDKITFDTEQSILYKHFNELRLSYTNMQISTLVESLLNNSCCEILSPTETVFEHLAWVAHIIGIFLHTRYPDQTESMLQHFLDKLKEMEPEEDDICKILNSLKKTGNKPSQQQPNFSPAPPNKHPALLSCN